MTVQSIELAQVRQSTGVAGPEEPLRWEVEITKIRKNVMTLHSQKNQAEYALNQILNFPLNQSIVAGDVSLDDPSFYLADRHMPGYFENPISFDILTEYMVKRGLDQSHELQQLDALIQAQHRSRASTRNSFLLPTVAAFANFSNNFYKSKQPVPFAITAIPQPPEGLDPRVPLYLGQLLSVAAPKIPDRNNWTVGVQLSFNLFNGLGTYATAQKFTQQLEQLQAQRKAVVEKVALRIRYEMHNAKASYFAIQQTRLQQEAAHKMLDIVTDAYFRGAVSILNLLDAQNAALGTDLIAANAFYDFFIEYMNLQRSLGQFDVLMTAEERDSFLKGLIEFMGEALKR